MIVCGVTVLSNCLHSSAKVQIYGKMHHVIYMITLVILCCHDQYIQQKASRVGAQ
jgi:uncharacterized protein YlbG (UPF0298 family)